MKEQDRKEAKINPQADLFTISYKTTKFTKEIASSHIGYSLLEPSQTINTKRRLPHTTQKETIYRFSQKFSPLKQLSA